MPSHPASSPYRHLQRCNLTKPKMGKHRMLASESRVVYQWNDFSEPRFLHLPTHRKVLSSLTWDNWFSFVNNNLPMFKLPDLSCKNSYIILAPHLTSLEQSLRVIWEAIFWAWRPKNVHRIKRNSQILGCVFFSSLQDNSSTKATLEIRTNIEVIKRREVVIIQEGSF